MPHLAELVGVAAAAAIAVPSRTLLPPGISTTRRLARRIAEWFDARERAAADREVLAAMSDRELLDIGIGRGSVNAVADRKWMRDGFF